MMKKSTILSLAAFSGTVACLLFLSSCLTTKSSSLDINNLSDKESIIEIAVIGSGPAGWSAAIYGARGGYSTVVFAGREPGGLLTKTTLVENYPGYSSIMGPVLMDAMKLHAVKAGVYLVEDTVATIDLKKWPYRIETDGGKVFHALSVIFATGALPKKLGVAGEERYWGSGVTSCAICDAPFFKGEDVVVVGGGDSAVEEALQIAPYANKVIILVRKGSMRAAPSVQERLKGYANISVRYNVSIEEIMGNDAKVTGVKLLDATTKQVTEMPVAGVFLAIGHDPNTALVRGAVAMNAAGYITVKDRLQETSVPGFFAAGEVEDDYYRQAIVAAGRGASAALDAGKFLHTAGWNDVLKKQLKNRLFKAATSSGNGEQPKQAMVRVISNEDSFNELITQNELVMVDFFTPSCTLCKQMLPAVEAVAGELTDAVFAKLDTMQVPAIAQQFFIQKVPCILAFHKGSLVGRYHDFMNEQQLRTITEQLMQDAAA